MATTATTATEATDVTVTTEARALLEGHLAGAGPGSSIRIHVGRG